MKNNVTSIIVDDEVAGINSVRNLIKLTNCPIEIVAETNSVESAFEKITSLRPQLIFLDIQLRKQTGFDLLDLLPKYHYEVIFVTAYDQFAIEAFKRQAISYLLKPIDPVDFKNAVERALKLIHSQTIDFNNFNSLNKYTQILSGTLPITNGSEVEYVKTSEILYVKADGSYSVVFLKDGSNRTVSRNLKFLEESLSKEHFIRTHRSFMINANHIEKHVKTGGGKVVLTGNVEIPISQNGKQKLNRYLNN